MKKKPIGGILLVIGIICAFYGINRVNSPISQIATAFGQSDSTGIGIIVLGVIAALVGAALLFAPENK